MDKFRVVSYKKENGYSGGGIIKFIGTFDECVQFYINNKAKYRFKGEYLELMTMDYCVYRFKEEYLELMTMNYCVKEELTCPKCHSSDTYKSSGLFDYDYICNNCGKNFNDERESSGLFGGK